MSESELFIFLGGFLLGGGFIAMVAFLASIEREREGR